MARRITGNGFTIIDRSKDVLRSAENATERAIAAATIMVQKEAKLLLNRASSPPASRPGEPPHKITGVLADSIDEETVETARGEFVGRVGTERKYGFWLEIGTRGGKIIRPKTASVLSWMGPDGVRRFAKSVVQGPILPRPYLRPALKKGTKNLPKLLRRAYRGVR